MNSLYIAWAISALVLIGSAVMLGYRMKGNALGIIIDNRGRVSLSQFQLVLWTIVVLSLLSGVYFARLGAGEKDFLDVTIPGDLLTVMGISIASTAVAGAVKAGKDLKGAHILGTGRPRFSQLFLTEEGTPNEADTIDITRFQNFWLTVIAVAAYIVLAVNTIHQTSSVLAFTSLPGFGSGESSLPVLLGISHAGYIANKVPDKTSG